MIKDEAKAEQNDWDAAREILRHLNIKGVCNTPAEAGMIQQAFRRRRLAEREAIVAWLRRWAIGSGWVHGKSPGAAWANGLNEAADAVEAGQHLQGERQ